MAFASSAQQNIQYFYCRDFLATLNETYKGGGPKMFEKSRICLNKQSFMMWILITLRFCFAVKYFQRNVKQHIE